MAVSDLRSVHIATLGRGVTEVMLLSEGALQDGHLGQEEFEGRAEHQASGTDGTVVFSDKPRFDPGMIVKARVTGAEGIDLMVERA